MDRTGLIWLQVVGGLSLLPFPLVLMVAIMSAPKNDVIRTLPYLLLTLYPAAWIALWIVSWRVFRRGSISLAYCLSAVPIILTLIGALVMYLTWPKTNRWG